MELKRVVVTGLGALTPLGNTVEEYWNALLNGISGAENITHFDASEFKTKFACEVKGFDPLDYFDRKEARKYDPYAQYGLVSADQAVLDSGIDLDVIDGNRVGVIWASGIGGIKTFQDETSVIPFTAKKCIYANIYNNIEYFGLFTITRDSKKSLLDKFT